MTIGEKILAARKSKDMTQSELGRLCGTTKQTIQRYEAGVVTNIPLDRVEAIASALGLSPAYLMDWEEPNKQTQPTPTLQNINGILQKLNPDQLAQAEAFLLFLEQSGK